MRLSTCASLSLLSAACLADAAGSSANQGSVAALGARQQQDIVTWDDKSLMINGERLMIFSAEFHPFRLPVPSLWLDVLQKIKAMGYTCVSFYVDWFLLEGKQGDFRTDGIFSYEPLFEAAKKTGLYLIARPGPYINAEVSGGGFPGWLSRIPGRLRFNDDAYMEIAHNYSVNIGRVIADAQITNGGPVILFQPENEYQSFADGYDLPDYDYWDKVKQAYRDAGIVVPLINNESGPYGYITTSTPSDIDIYGHDGYPLGFDCENPTVWPDDALPTDWLALHRQLAPDSPYSILEFQGGGFQAPGGKGFDGCAELTNHEFERVFYKNNFAAGVDIFNVYMTFGGTNWGNLGHPDGYTSYDYGSPITEERLVWREKYSEAKLEANFFHVSPAYLVADRFNASLAYTNTDAITVTPAKTNSTKFYISRQTKFNSVDTVPYRLHVETVNFGNLTVPQLSDNLVMTRRDSKIHVSDYPVGDHNLVYSTAEVFTWKQYDDKTVLVLYGGPNEYHELAIEGDGADSDGLVEGDGATITQSNGYTIVNWAVTPERKVVRLGQDLYVYLLNRNEAYNFWVPPVPEQTGTSDVIVKAGYLIRSVSKTSDGTTLSLTGDLNATTPLEIIGGATSGLSTLLFNNEEIPFNRTTSTGAITATLPFNPPSNLLASSFPKRSSDLTWRAIDALPEILPSYPDSLSALWPVANLTKTPNIAYPDLETPTSLYAGDYGFHAGYLIYRGTFSIPSSPNNSSPSSPPYLLRLETQGGTASGSSVWLDSIFLGSQPGNASSAGGESVYTISPSSSSSSSSLSSSEKEKHTITLLLATTGLNENYEVPVDDMKTPRGILSYSLTTATTAENSEEGEEEIDISWTLTGNLGGEDYKDRTRGPLNEGGLSVERRGWHLPGAPTTITSSSSSSSSSSSEEEEWQWRDSPLGPEEGLIGKAGVVFYVSDFDFDDDLLLSEEEENYYEIPISFVFGGNNGTTTEDGKEEDEDPTLTSPMRCQLYVNGWQFGSYVRHIGPQERFPVPWGILDFRRGKKNRVAVSLWAMDGEVGARVGEFRIEVGMVSKSGFLGNGLLEMAPEGVWEEREGVY